jgi:hypothetical protein
MHFSYTGSARQKLRENPEILREFLKMVANKGFPEIKTDKFQIRRLSITKVERMLHIILVYIL